MRYHAMHRQLAALVLMVGAAACTGARSTQNAGATNTFRPEPNTGTAPDYLVICLSQAGRQYAVAQDRLRLEDPVTAADGGTTIDGTADQGAEGLKRFRCRFDADLRFIEVMALTSDGE